MLSNKRITELAWTILNMKQPNIFAGAVARAYLAIRTAIAEAEVELMPYKDWFELVHREGQLTKRTHKAARAIRARGEEEQ